MSLMLRSEVELLLSREGPAQHTRGPLSLVRRPSLCLLGRDVGSIVLPATRADLLFDVFEVEEALLLVVFQFFADVAQLGLELFLRRVGPGDLDSFDVLHDVLRELDVCRVAHHDSCFDALLLRQRRFVIRLDHEPVVDLELLAKLVSVGDLEVQYAEQVVFLHDGVLEDVVFR